MESLFDRRVFERMESDFTGWYTIKDDKEIRGEFLGLDFSAGGIRVNTNKKILEGRALNLSLVSPEVKGPIQEAAQIVWQREAGPGLWQAGLKFYQPNLIHLWPLVDSKQYSIED